MPNTRTPARSLWRYNAVTGYWVHQRDTAPDTGAEWLAIFQRDEPGAVFCLSASRPTRAPKLRPSAVV